MSLGVFAHTHHGGAEGVSPLDRSLCFSDRSGAEGPGEQKLVWLCHFSHHGVIMVWLYIFLSSPHHNFFLPGLGSTPRTGLQLQLSEAGMIPRQEIVNMPLPFYVRIPTALTVWAVLSLHLAQMRMNVPIWSSGRNHLLVLYGWGEEGLTAEDKRMKP